MSEIKPTWESQCGRVQLYCADCLDILPLIPKGTVDAVVTDPPYGIDYNPSHKKWNGSKSEHKKIFGDDKPFDPSPFLEIPGFLCFFGGNYFSDKLPLGGWIVWDKRTRDNLDKMIGAPGELAWCNNPGDVFIIRAMHGGVVNLDSSKGNNEQRLHPTQKPVLVIEKIVDRYTKNANLILDPFMGSGTTGVAAIRLGRRFIGIEIEPKYFEIAKQRIVAELAQTSLLSEAAI